MKAKTILLISLLVTAIFILASTRLPLTFRSEEDVASPPAVKRYLYVAVPGIRDYLGYGGHGILVFDIENHHLFVKRIQTKGFHPDKTILLLFK